MPANRREKLRYKKIAVVEQKKFMRKPRMLRTRCANKPCVWKGWDERFTPVDRAVEITDGWAR